MLAPTITAFSWAVKKPWRKDINASTIRNETNTPKPPRWGIRFPCLMSIFTLFRGEAAKASLRIKGVANKVAVKDSKKGKVLIINIEIIAISKSLVRYFLN